MAEGVIPVRLWHKTLIPYLPRQQILGQWRECCAIAKSIAEKGTPNHVLVNRVMEYPIDHLDSYTSLIYTEMHKRGYSPDWSRYRYYRPTMVINCSLYENDLFPGWHNDRYLRQCLYNLQEKFDAGAIPKDEWQQITDRFPEYK